MPTATTSSTPNEVCGKCGDELGSGNRYKVRVENDKAELVLSWWCGNCTGGSQTAQCGNCSNRFDKAISANWITKVGSREYGWSTYCRYEDCWVGNIWYCVADKTANLTSNPFCTLCNKDKDGNGQRCRCGNGSERDPVHQSSCQPVLVFHGGGEGDDVFMGYEMEVEFGRRSSHEAAQFVREKLQLTEIAQCKGDGSLNNGFEVVTQPHTFGAYRHNTALWDTTNSLRDDFGARGWDPKTCGFHIHVGRDGFANGTHLHKFIEFIYRHPEEMMKFGGRKSSYAKFEDAWGFDEYDRPIFNIDFEKGTDLNGGDKYTAVNTSKEFTVELRFFRGTTKVDTIMAYLGMAHAIVEYTRDVLSDTTDEWYDWKAFDGWVTAHASTYPELAERMPSILGLSLESLNSLTIDA